MSETVIYCPHCGTSSNSRKPRNFFLKYVLGPFIELFGGRTRSYKCYSCKRSFTLFSSCNPRKKKETHEPKGPFKILD